MHHHDARDHDDHGGLHRDLRDTGAVIGRRRWLRMAARLGAAAGTLQLAGCGGDSPTSPSATTPTETTAPATTTTAPPSSMACSRILEETAGPYPADGSNGPTVLSQSDVVRADIRASFAGLSGTGAGVPLNIVFTIVSASPACRWQDAPSTSGTAIAPGSIRSTSTARPTRTTCAACRRPHIHFEVFPSLSAAASVANKVATSQIALP